jgi:Glycosyl transferase family group 2
MSIRRGRAEDPPAAADEHARPAAAGPEAAPADGEAETPAAGSAAGAASGAAGTEVPPGDDATDVPASDGVAGVPAADGAAGVAAADGGAEASSGADGEAEVPSADGEAEVSSGDGEAPVPSGDGEAPVPSGDGRAEVPAGGGAEVPPADGAADFPPASEYTPWPADDETALALNGDTLVLPVLGDIDDVTAPPSAEQQHPSSSPSRPHIAVGGTVALLDDRIAASGIDYKAYSALAGPLGRPRWDEPYRVQYRKIHRNRREWLATRLIAFVLVILDIRFLYWLIFQSKYPHLNGWQWHTSTHAAITDAYLLLLAAMAIGSIVMQIFLLVNVLTVSRACLAARDPIPVEPDTRLRVAFLTTLVPDKEPLEMAERDAEGGEDHRLRRAARPVAAGRGQLRRGQGNVPPAGRPSLQPQEPRPPGTGQRHVRRQDQARQPQPVALGARGRLRHRHVRRPRSRAAAHHGRTPARLLPRPEVAFVVSPQFYGNQENRITRWAESAQYLFHGVIQRAGNRRRCAMLVGTNVAVRTSAIKGGYVASITEDMATSFKIHATKSPTGRPWRSVYTPDLVAVGEGPSSWTDFFSQQTRWSAGTYDFLMRRAWREAFKLRPGAMLHYGLMLTYYPSVAIGWIMGITISACYLGFGVASLRTDAGWWLTYYVDVAAMQFVLYWFMRRHNVSPHEPAGSSGLSGMVLSAITAPIYARSLIKVVFRRKLRFDVTAKGSSSSPDRLWTFRYSLAWAVVPIVILVIAVTHHRPYPMMIAWTGVILTLCLMPAGIWLFDRARSGRGTGTPPSGADENRVSEPSEQQLTLAAK